uniref:Protein SMG7 n=1 Tax=Panagrellus redivivus TaxID=6233 RepID=A0A7E4UX18_PANRE
MASGGFRVGPRDVLGQPARSPGKTSPIPELGVVLASNFDPYPSISPVLGVNPPFKPFPNMRMSPLIQMMVDTTGKSCYIESNLTVVLLPD